MHIQNTSLFRNLGVAPTLAVPACWLLREVVEINFVKKMSRKRPKSASYLRLNNIQGKTQPQADNDFSALCDNEKFHIRLM